MGKIKPEIKESEVNYCFKIEVNRNEEVRLGELRTKIYPVMDHLQSKGKLASNISAMESLLNCWFNGNGSTSVSAKQTNNDSQGR